VLSALYAFKTKYTCYVPEGFKIFIRCLWLIFKKTPESAPALPPEALKNTKFYTSRYEMLHALPKNKKVLEVGTYTGYFANKILETCTPKELHLADLTFEYADEALKNHNLVTLHEGCLLYTSPSPRDRTRSRMPSSA